MLPKSSVISLRCNDRCTHGMMVKLHSDVIFQCHRWLERADLNRVLFFQSPDSVYSLSSPKLAVAAGSSELAVGP